MDADDIVANRLKLLAEYTDELRDYKAQTTSFRVYQDNKMLRRAIERTLQVAIETYPDIGWRLSAGGIPLSGR